MAKSQKLEVVVVRLSKHAEPFMTVALDLFAAVQNADQALLPDEVREAGDDMLELIERTRGEL